MELAWRNRPTLLAMALLFCVMAPRATLAEDAPAPADAEYNDLKFAKDLRAFEQSSLLDTYRAIGHRDKAWDALAQDFLEKFCHYSAYEPVWRGIRPDDVPTAETVRRLSNDVINLKCDDPQVLAAYGTLLKENNRMPIASRQLKAALVAMNDGKHPAYNILYICDLLLQIGRQFPLSAADRELVDSASIDATVRCMCEVPPTRAERYIRFRMIHMVTKDRPAVEAAIRERLDKARNVDLWLEHIFIAENEIHLGWVPWVSANAGPDAWQQTADHLSMARSLLTHAWKMDPTLPGPAAIMITVSMGQRTKGDDTPRAWFDRARTAKSDDRWALQSLLWSMRPRWGGSLDQVVSIGREFMASRRFDTQVLAWILETAWTLSSDRGQVLADTYAEPEIYRGINEMYRGYERALPAGAGRDWVLNEHAVLATQARQYVDARTLFERMGPKIDRQVFQTISTHVDRTISQVYAYTGPNAVEARTATQLAEANDPEALQHFTALAAACKPDDPEAYYYNSHMAELRFKAAFATGDWVTIQPKDGLYLWSPQQGKWEINGDTLIGTCDGSGLMLRFVPPTLDCSLEIEATLEYAPLGKGTNACGIYCDRTLQTWGNGVFYSVGNRDVGWCANGKTGVVRHSLETANLLHITLQSGKLSGTFNGQPVPIPAMTGKPVKLGPEARICIGGVYADAELTLKVTGLNVRKIDAEKE